MEVMVTISLGVRAGSLALIAFGLDSIVEIFASTVVIRNLRDRRRDPGDRRVHRSLRLIALAFWLLAAFLLIMSVRALVRGDRPDSSPLGAAYLAATAFVMFGSRSAEARDRRPARERDARRRGRDDVPRRVPEYQHPHRARAQRLARVVVGRHRGCSAGGGLRGERRRRPLAASPLLTRTRAE